MSLLISEHFTTLQGEGPSLGTPSYFIRLHGCNLDCSWCDTPYTWDGSEQGSEMEVVSLVDKVLESGVSTVVLTGGEPMLQVRKPGFHKLLRNLSLKNIRIEVETNGTVVPKPNSPSEFALDYVSQWNISPKLGHANIKARLGVTSRLVDSWLEVARHLSNEHRLVFKMVIDTDDDVEAQLKFIKKLGFKSAERVQVCLMPEGVTKDKQLAGLSKLWDIAAQYGYSVTPRLHTILFDDKRGI